MFLYLHMIRMRIVDVAAATGSLVVGVPCCPKPILRLSMQVLDG
jgi:hypothetical protein